MVVFLLGFLFSRRFQAALETIILIGGVVILSAASYFLMKGFLSTSGGSTQATMSRGTDVSRQDLLNLGLEAVVLPRAHWYSAASRFKTNFTLSNGGAEPSSVVVGLKNSSFLDQGVDLDEFEPGFISPVSGGHEELEFFDNGTHLVFTSPEIPAGGDLEFVLHYNNSSEYSSITSFDYSVSDDDFFVGDVSSSEKTDFDAPGLGAVNILNPGAGAGEMIHFSIPVNETSSVSEAGFSVAADTGAQTLSTSVLSADGLYNVVTGLSGGGMQIRAAYVSGELVFDFLTPSAGEYVFSCIVVDEWGNTGTAAVVVIVSGTGSGGGEMFLPDCSRESVNLGGYTNFSQGGSLVCGCDSLQGGDMVTNGGFESGDTGWMFQYGRAEVVTDFSYEGSNSCYINSSDSGDYAMQLVSDLPDRLSYAFYIDSSEPENSAPILTYVVLTDGGSDVKFLAYYSTQTTASSHQCGEIVENVYSICDPVSFGSWHNITVYPKSDMLDGFGNATVPDGYLVYLAFMNVGSGSAAFTELFFDAVEAYSSADGAFCDSGNDDGIADGVCFAGQCHNVKVYRPSVDPNFAPRAGPISVSTGFANATEVNQCVLTVDSTQHTMDIDGQSATFLFSPGSLSAGDYTAGVSCTDANSNTGSSSDDFTVTYWEEIVQLFEAESGARQRVAASGPQVHVVWGKGGGGGVGYLNSSDSGASWSDNYTISDVGYTPAIAVDGSSVHVVWSAVGIKYRNSTDNGATWGSEHSISGEGTYPAIAVSGSSVHVVWHDADVDAVYYVNSSDSGETWGSAIIISSTSNPYEPAIAVSGSSVHVVWYDVDSDAVYYVNSSDSGETWGSEVVLGTSSDMSYPDIAVSGDNVHAVWEGPNDDDSIYYANSSDGGVTWNEGYQIVTSDSSCERPSIAVDGDNVYVVWINARGGDYVEYTYSSDGGTTWGGIVPLSEDSGTEEYPGVAVGGNVVNVVWGGETGSPYVYYRRYNPD